MPFEAWLAYQVNQSYENKTCFYQFFNFYLLQIHEKTDDEAFIKVFITEVIW